MDKEQIINAIKANSHLSYDEVKTQADSAGLPTEEFDEAWNEAKQISFEKAQSTTNTELIQKTKLKKTNLSHIFLFLILTGGFYYPFWFINRRKALNELNSDTKIKKEWTILYAILLFGFVIGIFTVLATFIIFNSPDSKVYSYMLLLILLALFTRVIHYKLAFDVRKILSDHYQTQLSKKETLYRPIIYLQMKINQFVGMENEK